MAESRRSRFASHSVAAAIALVAVGKSHAASAHVTGAGPPQLPERGEKRRIGLARGLSRAELAGRAGRKDERPE